MTLSPRERLIAIAAASVATIFLLDRYALTPYLARRAAWRLEIKKLSESIEDNKFMLDQEAAKKADWDKLIKAGLSTDPAMVESSVMSSMRDWVQESGLSLASIKPERVTMSKTMPEAGFQVVAIGTLDGVSRLLRRIETADLPLRVEETTISARREGSDDLSITLRLAALCLPEKNTVAAKPAGAAKEGELE